MRILLLSAATPFVILLMEGAAYRCVANVLEEGMSTVGALINMQHIKATPMGLTLKATAKLVEIDRKRLVFEVEAYDDVEMVAHGTHERFIVDTEKFMTKANAKRI